MKIGIIGSRKLVIENLQEYLPEGITEIVSGGAKGIDTCAKLYAKENNLKLTEFLPNYEKFGRVAPLKRNLQIIEYSDEVIAFWDGDSKGAQHVINTCSKINKKITVYTNK